MSRFTENQRTINIINKAVENGFEFDEKETLEDVRISAEEMLIENDDDAIEEECEVVSLGGHGQRVDWSDGKGFDFWSQGEIVDYSSHWRDAPETKVFYETLVDSEGNVVKLFYLVGETESNVPEGFYYSEKEKGHVKSV